MEIIVPPRHGAQSVSTNVCLCLHLHEIDNRWSDEDDLVVHENLERSLAPHLMPCKSAGWTILSRASGPISAATNKDLNVSGSESFAR